MLFHQRQLTFPDWPWTPGPENELWTHPTPGNDGSSELELHWLLYSLVSIIKPKVAFESGCCHGFASYWMAKAVYDNGVGAFVTCDVNDDYVRETSGRICEFWTSMEWTIRIGVAKMRAIDHPMLPDADFFFCDSNYGDRAEELKRIKPGCIALVHDTNDYARQWSGGAPDIKETVNQFQERLYFPATLRGFALLRKA